MGRRRQRLDVAERAGNHRHLHLPPVRIGMKTAWNLVVPEHREVGGNHLALCRKVQPQLKQLERVRPSRIEQRKHLRMHDSGAGGQPLHVAHPEAGGRAERIGMIDITLADDGHRLEAAMRMLRKAGDDVAVVHAPAVLALEVLADLASGKRGLRSEPIVTGRIEIDVMDAEEKRVVGLPALAERRSEEHTSELQSQSNLVCRLLLEKKKKKQKKVSCRA